jgi:hypothetical protein
MAIPYRHFHVSPTREKGKLRDLGMVFKPSFKCFKNEKTYLYSSDSKTRNFTV